MSTTYRSLFLACDACKMQVDSDAKRCKHCGRVIWLKDVSEVSKSIFTSTEILKQDLEGEVNPVEGYLQREELQPELETLQRAKLQEVLGRWLPVIFPNYYVAPNPMPEDTLDFLVQHMGKERIYNMSVQGYGFDPVNKGIFIFSDNAVLYKELWKEGTLCEEIPYASIEELTTDDKQLIVKTDLDEVKYFSVQQECALAEMLSTIKSTKINLYHNNSITDVLGAQNGISNSDVSWDPIDTQLLERTEQKIYCSVKEYIRDNITGFMRLVMLGARICMGMQCFCFLHYGIESRNLSAIVFAVLLEVFAIKINYCKPVIMWFALLFCGFGILVNVVGTKGWSVGAVVILAIALALRGLIGIEYKEYMESMNK